MSAASNTFNMLLKKIENCGLNFAMTRTPFSASISLKSSFCRGVGSNVAKSQLNPIEETESKESDEISLKLENATLKSRLAILEQKLLEQKGEIDKKFEDEKFVVKACEEKEAEFRADLLKVKSERKQMSVKANSLEKECQNLELEITRLMTEINDLKTDVSDKNDVLKKSEVEVTKLQAESILLEKVNSDLRRKIESVSEMNKKVNEVQMYPCTVCSFKTETKALLKDHVVSTHYQNKQTQVNQSPTKGSSENTSFLEYCCFYCDLTIKSTEHLQTHRIECQDTHVFYPCELCGAKCTSEIDLRRHRTTYHELGTWCNIREKELYWCEVCPLYYEKMIDLEFHRRGFH